MSMDSHGVMILKGKTELLGGKPVPMQICPPQIPHRLTRMRTQAYTVRGRQLTAWVMARPMKNINT